MGVETFFSYVLLFGVLKLRITDVFLHLKPSTVLTSPVKKTKEWELNLPSQKKMFKDKRWIISLKYQHMLLQLLCMALSVTSSTSSIKIILMYASCDDQLNYVLHLLHKSIASHLIVSEKEHDQDLTGNFKHKEVFHVRHNLSDACMWVRQETIAVIAISNETEKWEGIDKSAHNYNLPHFVSSNLCHCRSYLVPDHSEYLIHLENAVFEYLKDDFLHYVIILHEEESTCGTHLGSLLSLNGVRVSHLRVTAKNPNILKTVERFFDAWNMVDLSDDGRFLISLGSGNLTDSLLKKLFESSMHNKRTKILLLDKVEKWQNRLQHVKAYEVDIVVVSPEASMLDDCPVAIELLPFGSHNHKSQGPCTNVSSELKELGDTILRDFQRNFSKDCCPQPGLEEMHFTFYQSFPYENGTQRLKPEAIWSYRLGLMKMMPVDFETITLRIAVVEYRPYVAFDDSRNGDLILEDCVFKLIIEFLSKRLNFKYKLVRALEDEWGSKVGHQWDGAIGMVMRGEADMIPYLTSTPKRREALDYSKPLAYVKYGMLVAFPSEPPRAFIFFRPFKKEVWFLFIVSVFVISFILHKIHKWSCKFCSPPKRFVKGLSTFSRCFWLIFGAMLNQGGVHLPATNSARMVLASWWLAVLVIMATFSANLIAFLAFPEPTWVVENLDDLVKHKMVRLTMKQDCPVLEDFRESEREAYQKIRQHILDNPKRMKFIKIKRDVIEDVAKSKTVFIDDLNYLNRMIEKDYIKTGYCRLTIAPAHFSKMKLALGFRRGASILRIFNEEIQLMQETGVLEHWKAQLTPQRDECFHFDPNLHGQSEIILEDLQGPFYLLAIGLVFGLLFLTSEWIWNTVKICYKKYIQRRNLKRLNMRSSWR